MSIDSTVCSRPVCNEPAKYGCRQMCEHHYRKTVRMGINGYVPAEPVREHVTKLRALGWTWEQIGTAAGVSSWVPHKAGTGQTRRLLKACADAILAVPLEPRASQRGVDPTGTRRRVQALAWMGWPCEQVANRAGTTRSTLRTLILHGRRVSYSLARRVAAVYDELCMQPGPSRVAAGRAKGFGFAPPLAWDETTIDDPAALPDMGAKGARSTTDVADEARHLLGFGLSTREVAKRLTVSESWIRQLLGGGKRAAA